MTDDELVQAFECGALEVYRRYGRLFLPMKTIAQLEQP